MRRGLAVFLSLAFAVAAAGGGWLAGRNIKSPDQAASEAEPPPASLITVAVKLEELIADVIIRADVGYDEPEILGLSGGLGDLESTLVVTSAPERGAVLDEGSVAIEVAGRPVFVLEGPVPVFRSLRPQDRGPDVEQLETALARLGFFSSEPDSLWDKETGDAVRALYEQAGYAPNGPNESEKINLEAARTRVERGRTNLSDTQRELVKARVRPTELAIRQARTSVATAEVALTDARSALSVIAPNARRALSDKIKNAREEVSVAQSSLDAARQAARDAAVDLVASETARNNSANAFSQAQVRLQSAEDGVHPDTGTVPTASQHEALRNAMSTSENSLAAAERQVDSAKRFVEQANWAVVEAEEGLADAESTLEDLLSDEVDLEAEIEGLRLEDDGSEDDGSEGEGIENKDSETEGDARAITQNASQEAQEDSASQADNQTKNGITQDVIKARLAVRSAEEQLATTEEALADLLKDPDTADLERVLARNVEELADAESDLADLEASTGVWLPAGELIVLKRLPVRVDLLTAERGTTITRSFMTVTGSELAVRGSISERDIDRVSEGMQIQIEDRSLASPILGTIRLLDRRAGTRDVAIDRHYLEITADGIPDPLIGRNVKIVIPVGGTDGPVLVVPNAALSATADGSTRVEVDVGDGTTRFVTVEAGLSTGGLVEVTPVEGELQEGDQVVVGVATSE